ncbi:O-antigen translocase, partial [Bacteroides ovatus]
AIVLTCKILMFGWSGYAVVTVFLVLTTYYSYTGLDRRIGIRQVIINKLHRKN